MQSQEKDNLIIARLFPGENVFEQLEEICLKHSIKTGIFISGIGQLASFELGFFKERGNYMNQKFENPFEMLNLNGLASLNDKSRYDFHLHATLSGSEKNTLGGHFIDGIVSITLEIVILKTEIVISRRIEEETGLAGLFL
ncbi:MAG: DUF296 domain-containing protein [bacterium]|nr:DUF296 domain-containing protein [bacterium]